MTHHIALYGTGGVGKTTLSANISASMVEAGFTVALVGCDAKADSAVLLNSGLPIPNVLDQLRNKSAITIDSIVHSGFKGVSLVELGDPGYSGVFTFCGISRGVQSRRLSGFKFLNRSIRILFCMIFPVIVQLQHCTLLSGSKSFNAGQYRC